MDDLQAHHDRGSAIELPEPSFECSQESTRTEVSACQSSGYASLIYVTGQRCFWLLTSDALNAIQKSADRLSGIIEAGDAESRFEGLKSLGISDLFVPAHPRTFLPLALQDEWLSLERQEQHIEAEITELIVSFEALNNEYAELYNEVRNAQKLPAPTRRRFSDLAAEYNREKKATPDKVRELRHRASRNASRIVELREMGFTAAETAGFVVQDDTLYSPHQQKIAQLLREYQTAKAAFLEHELPEEAKYHSFVRLCRGHNESVECQLEPSEENLAQIEQFLEDYHGQFGYIGPYLEKAIELASNGVAVAEYVLANHGDIRSGLDKLSEYHRMERDYRKVEAELENAVSDWAKVLGRNGPIPQAEIAHYREKLDEHRERMYRFREKTEALAKNLEPLRLFVWDPDDFAAEPYRVLIKPGMPLREFTQIGSENLVKHFNLTDLPGIKRHVDAVHPLAGHNVYGQETAEQVALSLKKAQAIGQDDVLDNVLEGLGCIKLTLDRAWFSDRGLFLPDPFYSQVQQDHTVPALASDDERNSWGIHLRSLIFERDAREHLMLFDDSYMAQFSRFVLTGVDRDVADYVRKNVKVTAQASATGPASGADVNHQFIEGGKRANRSKVSYDLAKVSVGGKLTLMQGDLDLLDIRLPEPEDAVSERISYRTDAGNGEMDVGRFYCKLNAKLTGYVGANVLLSGGLGVEIEKGKGLTLAGLRDGAPEGHVGGFAGVQAGVLASTSLYWSLPDEVRKKVNYLRVHDPIAEWSCVGKLHAGLTGSWGVGFSRSFQLGMHNGKLVFSGDAGLTTGLGLKGKLAFEIDFNAVPYWMAIVQHELHKNDYRHLEWISPDAFGYLSQLGYLFMATALDVSFLASRPWSFVQQVFDSINSSERAGMVALRIERVAIDASEGRNLDQFIAFQEWFTGLQPEAIGPLLHNLVSDPSNYETRDGVETKTAREMLTAQQIAIFQCLAWMDGTTVASIVPKNKHKPGRAQRQFQESLIRMNPRGMILGLGSEQNLVARNNIARLDEFMGKDLVSRSDRDRYRDYQLVRDQLGMHIFARD